MENVLLTVHLIACIAMTGVIMLQRSEGGVQGMSGGGTGGLISGRGAASVLVRTTMICAGIFFVTSLVMVRLNGVNSANPYAVPQNQQNNGINIPSAPATPDPFAIPTTVAPTPATTSPVDPFAATPGASPTAAAPTGAPTSAAPAPSPTAAAPVTPAPSPQQ